MGGWREHSSLHYIILACNECCSAAGSRRARNNTFKTVLMGERSGGCPIWRIWRERHIADQITRNTFVLLLPLCEARRESLKLSWGVRGWTAQTPLIPPDILHILIIHLYFISFRHFRLGPTSWLTLSCKSQISKYCLILYIFIYIYRCGIACIFDIFLLDWLSGFADYCCRFYTVKKGTFEIKCIRVHEMFCFFFSPPTDIRHSRQWYKKTKAQWVSNGLHRYRLRETGPNVKMRWLQTLVSFSSVMLLWPLKWHHLYFPASLNGGANRPLLLYFFCAVHKLLRTINLPSAFRLSV